MNAPYFAVATPRDISTLVYTAPPGKIAGIFEGAPGRPGLEQPHAGIGSIPIDRVHDAAALAAWAPAAGRCAALEEGGLFRLGAAPCFPVTVLLEPPC